MTLEDLNKNISLTLSNFSQGEGLNVEFKLNNNLLNNPKIVLDEKSKTLQFIFTCDELVDVEKFREDLAILTGFATETKGQLSKYKFGYQVALGLLNKMLEHFGNADLEVVKEVKSFLQNSLDSLYSNLDREC